MDKVITVNGRDNLGNRMIQYMVALALSDRLPGSVITGVELPEWNVRRVPTPTSYEFDVTLRVSLFDPDSLSLREAARLASIESTVQIVLDDYVQRVDLFDEPARYRDVFPAITSPYRLMSNELLINIRAGDILCGVPHYPLLPASYYKWLCEYTGLNPVFCGQLDPSPYTRLLKSTLPDAKFISSQGAISDFNLMRSARHIAVSVSTFSWLASWLSEAETIFLPLCGFLNPAHDRRVDLLPVEDKRYRFVIFPLYYGLPEQEMIEHHRVIEGSWREVSSSQVAVLKKSTPLLARRSANIPFEPIWYTHTYLDAAKEISDGWFIDPLHHYLEIGRLRGHYPTRFAASGQPAKLKGRNLALGKRASQSSVSLWSTGKTEAEDASVATSGRIWEDKYFHTERDDPPWWMVDLGGLARISAIRIFNRDGPPHILARTRPLMVHRSLEAHTWVELFTTDAEDIIGGRSGGALVWTTEEHVVARYVRVTIPREEYLHLAEVEVYGDWL